MQECGVTYTPLSDFFVHAASPPAPHELERKRWKQLRKAQASSIINSAFFVIGRIQLLIMKLISVLMVCACV